MVKRRYAAVGWASLWATLSGAGCGHAVEGVADTAAGTAGAVTAPNSAGMAGAPATPDQPSGGSGGLSLDPEPPSAGDADDEAEPQPHPAKACANPVPLPSGGGYQECEDGSLRRPQPAACVSALPRSEPVTDRVFDECEADADCIAQANGYCFIGTCYYGCVTDAECPAEQLCFCDDLIGHCQNSACASDADCPTGYPCTGNRVNASEVDFRCQSPLDECQTDGDCNQFDSRMHCQSDGTRRLCVRRYVG